MHSNLSIFPMFWEIFYTLYKSSFSLLSHEFPVTKWTKIKSEERRGWKYLLWKEISCYQSRKESENAILKSGLFLSRDGLNHLDDFVPLKKRRKKNESSFFNIRWFESSPWRVTVISWFRLILRSYLIFSK